MIENVHKISGFAAQGECLLVNTMVLQPKACFVYKFNDISLYAVTGDAPLSATLLIIVCVLPVAGSLAWFSHIYIYIYICVNFIFMYGKV